MMTPDGFLPLSDIERPLTYRYHIATMYGPANMELTVNAALLDGTARPIVELGYLLFGWAIAPAMSFLSSLVLMDAYDWQAGVSIDTGQRFPSGQQFGLPAKFDDGVAVVMHTNDQDRRARRRLIYPTVPRSWIGANHRLSPDGAARMLELLRGMVAGMNRLELGSECEWLLYYPEAIPNPLGGAGSVGFRRVHHVRLCEYTVPVPTATP